MGVGRRLWAFGDCELQVGGGLLVSGWGQAAGSSASGVGVGGALTGQWVWGLGVGYGG